MGNEYNGTNIDSQVKTHSDSIGGHKHLARIIRVVELLRLSQLGAGRQTSVDYSHFHPSRLNISAYL